MIFLTVFTRNSFSITRDLIKENVYICHDITHWVWQTFYSITIFFPSIHPTFQKCKLTHLTSHNSSLYYIDIKRKPLPKHAYTYLKKTASENRVFEQPFPISITPFHFRACTALTGFSRDSLTLWHVSKQIFASTIYPAEEAILEITQTKQSAN